jgi:hypothetical protein
VLLSWIYYILKEKECASIYTTIQVGFDPRFSFSLVSISSRLAFTSILLLDLAQDCLIA